MADQSALWKWDSARPAPSVVNLSVGLWSPVWAPFFAATNFGVAYWLGLQFLHATTPGYDSARGLSKPGPAAPSNRLAFHFVPDAVSTATLAVEALEEGVELLAEAVAETTLAVSAAIEASEQAAPATAPAPVHEPEIAAPAPVETVAEAPQPTPAPPKAPASRRKPTRPA